VDERIIEALANRRKLAEQIIQAKGLTGTPIRDFSREEQLLADLIAKGRNQGLDAHLVTRVFHEIIDDSIRSSNSTSSTTARPARIASPFRIEGAYSELAGRKHFAPYLDHTLFTGVATLEQVIDAIEDGDVDYGLLPVENTTAGASTKSMTSSPFPSSPSSARKSSASNIACSPSMKCLWPASDRYTPSASLAECMKFVAKLPNCQALPYEDSAMAVKKVKNEKDPSLAAIASEEPEALWFKILRRNIEDQQNNFTRFLILAKKPAAIDLRIPCKTSLIMATSHEEDHC